MSWINGWFYLGIGLLLSLIGNPLLKISNGFEKPMLGALAMVLMFAATFFWGMSIKTLPLAVAYVIWSGVGTFVFAIIGMMYFNEPMTVLKAVFMLLVLIGCIGLKVITK